MPKLTPDQTLAIAQLLSQLARTLEDYRFQHFKELTELQQSTFTNAEDNLRRVSSAFVSYGLDTVMDNAQASIDQLAAITKNLAKDVTRLSDVQKALSIVGALVQLGTAFGTLNPGAIASALQAAASAL